MRIYLFLRHREEGRGQFVYVTNQFISSQFLSSLQLPERERVNFCSDGCPPFFRGSKKKVRRRRKRCYYFSLSLLDLEF